MFLAIIILLLFLFELYLRAVAFDSSGIHINRLVYVPWEEVDEIILHSDRMELQVKNKAPIAIKFRSAKFKIIEEEVCKLSKRRKIF